ncbi:MAG: glycerate kinase [Actinomycetota bacterium]|nr:glycerate kinase [Actinomycetota bacterium]
MATVLIAPDKFKDSLSASEVAAALKTGMERVRPATHIITAPLADGGEGTVDALIAGAGGERIEALVTGPLGEMTLAFFGLINEELGQKKEEVAVLEMAAASGLSLIPKEKRNPLFTTTYGTGELVLAALKRRPSKIIIGIGGSATTDGGMGMAQALGVKFFDEAAEEIKDFGSGALLEKVARIDASKIDERIKGVDFIVASDVKNHLYGPDGAAFVYSPQKGADPKIVEMLDRGLRNFADVILRDLGIDVANKTGAGAAGGLGAGLMVFLGAKMHSGIDLIIAVSHLKEKMALVDLVITGEGKLDVQTAFGKTPLGVLSLARSLGVPCVVVAGVVEEGAGESILEAGATAAYSLLERAGGSKDESIERAAELLKELGEEIALKHLDR